MTHQWRRRLSYGLLRTFYGYVGLPEGHTIDPLRLLAWTDAVTLLGTTPRSIRPRHSHGDVLGCGFTSDNARLAVGVFKGRRKPEHCFDSLGWEPRQSVGGCQVAYKCRGAVDVMRLECDGHVVDVSLGPLDGNELLPYGRQALGAAAANLADALRSATK